jgi:uncharacterized LabA/DUF88 family protein
MPTDHKIMVFIDGSNFYHSLMEKYNRANIDFKHLVDSLVGSDRNLVRVYYYNAPVNQKEVPDQYKAQQKFFQKLRNLDYFEIRLGRLEKRQGKMVEKGVDVQLGVDMVAFAAKNLYETAIIISGDGDFAGAIQHVKDMGKHVELAFPDLKCFHLRQICDKFVHLETTHLKFPRSGRKLRKGKGKK